MFDRLHRALRNGGGAEEIRAENKKALAALAEMHARLDSLDAEIERLREEEEELDEKMVELDRQKWRLEGERRKP